jgi:hypothetical protein
MKRPRAGEVFDLMPAGHAACHHDGIRTEIAGGRKQSPLSDRP